MAAGARELRHYLAYKRGRPTLGEQGSALERADRHDGTGDRSEAGIMSDEQHCAVGRGRGQQVPDGMRARVVQAGRRLVEDQDRRIAQESPRNAIRCR